MNIRRPYPFHLAVPDGVVHRVHYVEVVRSDDTACGVRLGTLVSHHKQLIRTDAPVTCLMCLVHPMELVR